MAASAGSTGWGDPTSLHKYGQGQYRQGNYPLALEAFNQALQLKLPDTLGILDNRAATFSKLGQLEPALRDGRRMVKTDSKDGRGYLRCGKVLQLMEKNDKAVEIYTYGLKVLPSDLPASSIIMQLKDKLLKKMEGPKQMDPFMILPPEIAAMILEHFSFRQMVGILRVSKKWEKYLSSLPNLWTHLDLSIPQRRRSAPTLKPITISAVRRYTSRSQSRLTHATLANISPNSVQKSMEHISRHPLLHLNIRLDIKGVDPFQIFRASTKLTTLITSPLARLDVNFLPNFINNCPRLEHLESHAVPVSGVDFDKWPDKMPNLRTIIFATEKADQLYHSIRPSRHPLGVPGIFEGSISETLPNLEELRLSDILRVSPFYLKMAMSSLCHFRRLILKGINLSGCPELPESLEQLCISGARLSLAIPLSEPFIKKLPNLKSLTLTESKFVTLEFLQNLLPDSESKLTSLSLGGSVNLDGDDICQLARAGYLSTVVELSLASLAKVTDRLAPVIIEHVPNLKVLDMTRTEITGVFVKELVDAPDLNIERLLVEECGNLSADAIKYARNRGVDVVSVVRG